jgi:hypothetical protein
MKSSRGYAGWKNDVPASIWERLWDWGYDRSSAKVGHAVIAGLDILELLEGKDEYYYLDYADTPEKLEGIKTEVTEFVSKYEKYKRVGI